MLASKMTYKGYTHRYPIKTVRVVPSRPKGPSSLGVPTIGIRQYVKYKTYRGLYPSHPFDTVCIRKRRVRQVIWNNYEGLFVILASLEGASVAGGGRVSHHDFLGLVKTTKMATMKITSYSNGGS